MMYVRTPLRQERLASTRDMRLRSAGMTLRMSALVYLGGDCCWLLVALLARVCCAVACACLSHQKGSCQHTCQQLAALVFMRTVTMLTPGCDWFQSRIDKLGALPSEGCKAGVRVKMRVISGCNSASWCRR